MLLNSNNLYVANEQKLKWCPQIYEIVIYRNDIFFQSTIVYIVALEAVLLRVGHLK